MTCQPAAQTTGEHFNRSNGCACGPDVIVGNYKNQVEVPIPNHMAAYRDARVAVGLSGTVCIDRCILPEIEALWALGIRTYGSCCGHNTSASMVNVHSDDAHKMLSLGYLRCQQPEGCYPHTFHLKTAGTMKGHCPQWRCAMCGCLWREWPTSWSLWDGNQRPCGFCDNSPCFTAVISQAAATTRREASEGHVKTLTVERRSQMRRLLDELEAAEAHDRDTVARGIFTSDDFSRLHEARLNFEYAARNFIVEALDALDSIAIAATPSGTAEEDK